MKWLLGLSGLLRLPFVAFAGIAIVLFSSVHGDPGRVLQGCIAAVGAVACGVPIGLAQRSARNRAADEAIARSEEWDARQEEHDLP